MKRFLPLFFLPGVFLSKNVSKNYRKKEFSYQANGNSTVLPIIVPRGYAKEERKDTAGISLYVFYYPQGYYLYAAHLVDTSYELQAINKSRHQPLIHRLGGQVYKGQDRNELFYHEIRQGNLRFGYRNVPGYLEFEFDSATNFASLQHK